MDFQRGMMTIIMMLLCHFVDAQRSSPCHRKCKYVEVFQQANCEDRSLHAIPIECNAASYLSLRYNHITTIEPGLFKGFPFLKYLILSNNNISRVEANTFVGAPQLKSIKLLYNNLQVLDRNALNGTENRLRNIYLSRNSLRFIESGTFQLVPRLEVIDLYRNHLTRLTSGVFDDLEYLERLFLGMNELVDLPENIFKDLISLVYLDLSNNSISSLTIDLFVHMNHLKTIDLSGNRLVDIGNVLDLPNIRLDLRWNRLGQLRNVSLEILNSNVETLYLEGNPLYCNCSIEPLRLWYKGLTGSMIDHVTTDNPVCSGPQRLANSTIYSLKVSLCHDMTAENTKISMVHMAMMNLGGYNHIGNDTNATNLTYQNVTENFETSKANGRMKVIIITSFAAIVLVVIFVAVSVVLLKRRSYETKERKDLDPERSVPKPGEDSTGVGEKNDIGTSESSRTPTSVSLIGATTSKENISGNIRNETCNTEKTPSPGSAIKFREGVLLGEVTNKENTENIKNEACNIEKTPSPSGNGKRFWEGNLLGEVTNKENNTENIKNETCNIEKTPSPSRNGKKLWEGNLLGEVTNKENNDENFRNETCNIEKTPLPSRSGNKFREGTQLGVVTDKENINGIIKSKTCNIEKTPSPSRSAKSLSKVDSNRKTRKNHSYREKKSRSLRM